MLFDTHLHLINLKQLDYPWLAEFEQLKRDNSFESYMRDAARLGITECLHMEVDVAEHAIERETEIMGAYVGKPDSPMRGVISSCRPEHDDFPDFLERNSSNPTVKGFRRVLHVVPDDVSQSLVFRDNLKLLSCTGLTFDLCVLPRQLGLARELVDYCPDVSFVLDHCGVPDVAGGALDPWRTDIRKISERPNVHAKISGLIAYGNPATWGLDDIRPFVEETVAAFGPNRIVWGSDSPVCNLGGGLPTWVAATHALTNGWSAEERALFYRENACALWKIPSNSQVT